MRKEHAVVAHAEAQPQPRARYRRAAASGTIEVGDRRDSSRDRADTRLGGFTALASLQIRAGTLGLAESGRASRAIEHILERLATEYTQPLPPAERVSPRPPRVSFPP